MPFMKHLLFTFPLVALAACDVAAPTPIVSDYNGRTVKVQYHSFALGDGYRDSPVYFKAVETCKLDGRRDAAYQGVRNVSQYSGEHVFLCI